MPGLRFKLWPVFARQQVPVGAGAGGRDRRRHRPGRRAAADRRQERRLQARRSATSPTSAAFVDRRRPEGRAAPGAAAGHAACRSTRSAFVVITSREVFGAAGVARAGRARPTTATSRPSRSGSRPEQLQVVVIAPQGDVDVVGIVTTLEGAAARQGRHRQPPRRLRRHRRAGGRRRRHRRRAHRHAARLEERPAQQLPGLPGVPRRRRPHRPAARPAALRRLPAQPVPGAGRAGADARREPGRGRGHQGLRRPADARHVGRRVQVRLDRAPRPPRHLAGAAAHRQVRHQPARLRGRDRADVHPHPQLGRRRISQAHDLDARLEPIVGKSREGFVFTIDLQVQIHVSDTKAPKVISMVGTMLNLVNEVLQSAVGNHFRNTLQDLEAVRFIETRQEVQRAAFEAVTRVPGRLRRRDPRRLHPGRRLPRGAGRGADPAGDRQPGAGDLRRAAAGGDGPHRDGEGPGHGRHAGGAGRRAGRRGDQGQRGPGPRGGGEGEAAYVRLTGQAEADRRRPSVWPRPRPPRRSGWRGPPASTPRGTRSAGRRPPWSRWPTRSPRATSRSCPRCSSPAAVAALDGLAATLMRYLGTNGKRAPVPAPAPPPEEPTALGAAEVAEGESRPDAPLTPTT